MLETSVFEPLGQFGVESVLHGGAIKRHLWPDALPPA
jgi:hypothetical protein